MNGFEQKRRCEMTRKGKRQTERRCKLRSVCTRAQQPYRNVAVNPRIGHYLTAGRQRPQIGEQFLHLLWERILSTVVAQRPRGQPIGTGRPPNAKVNAARVKRF